MKYYNRILSLFVLGVLLIPLITIGTVNAESPLEVYLEPDEDAYIDEWYQDVNFNNSYLFASSFEDIRRKSYLKFTLPTGQILGAVLMAKISEVGYYGHGEIQAWSTTSETWHEDTLTWETAPAPIELLDEDTSGNVGQTDYWVVDSFAEQGGTISIILCLENSAWYDQGAKYYSKDHPNVDYQPKLFVQYIPSNPEIEGADIRSPGDGEKIRRFTTVDIIAQIPEVSGEVPFVTFQIDDGDFQEMYRHESSDRYCANWFVIESAGDHTITVKAYYDTITFKGDTSVRVVSGYVAELWFEIDYMEGFEPSLFILGYWMSYWDSRAINAHIILDDEVPHTYRLYTMDEQIPDDNPTSFWYYESHYNDPHPHDDPDDPNCCFTPYKWVLFADHGPNDNTGGRTYKFEHNAGSGSGDDIFAGNYLAVFSGRIEEKYGTDASGMITAVTMHEAGHSVGVFVGRIVTQEPEDYIHEVYDSDIFSVMAQGSFELAGFTNHWYYSREYWATRNLEYY